MTDHAPEVKTPLGQLKGSSFQTAKGETIYTFQGIPFAQPPVGELRFKDPVPIKPWTGLRSAQQAPPVAPCPAAGPMNPYATGVLPGSDEDCLYLNVFTPQVPKPDLKLPVMAFIHGGGFQFGSGNMAGAGPDYLVPKGVILVTINYRLAAFGFLSLQTPDCPGNFGLKDQTQGLKWIQENISAFGGDPGNVTIFGESAGSASVQYLTLSPLSRGLFHRAIAQSGSALNRWAYSRHPLKSGLLLAKRLGCETNDPNRALEVIRNASTEDILLKSADLFSEIEGIWSNEHILCFPFVPTAEPKGTPNAFLTKTPAQAVADGDFADVPYMTGACADEMIFSLPSVDFTPPWDDDKYFQRMLPKELGIPEGSAKAIQAAEKLKEFYFPNGSSQNGWIQATSDLMFVHGIYKTVEAQSSCPKKTTPNYLYMLNYYSESSGIKKLFGVESVKGVSHGDDLAFLMTVPALGANPLIEGSVDMMVQDTMTTLWTNFAKTGVASPNWPIADPKEGYPFLEITQDITPKTGFFSKQAKFWDELYAFLKS